MSIKLDHSWRLKSDDWTLTVTLNDVSTAHCLVFPVDTVLSSITPFVWVVALVLFGMIYVRMKRSYTTSLHIFGL